MKQTHIKLGQETKQKIAEGVKLACDAISPTLGPKGRPAILDREYTTPYVVDDGVSIAKELSHPDKLTNIGLKFVKEVAESAQQGAGDGTTTSVILCNEMLQEGIKNIAAGANPTMLKKGIDLGAQAVIEALRAMATPLDVNNLDKLSQVATVSANDPVTGALIAKAVNYAGTDGNIAVSTAPGFETEVLLVDGYSFDQGMVSSYFINNPDKNEFKADDCIVAIIDREFSSDQEAVCLLEYMRRHFPSKNVLVIANNLAGDAVSLMVLNSIKKIVPACGVNAPGHGQLKKDMLEDIATLTGAKVLGDIAGTDFTLLGAPDPENPDVILGEGWFGKADIVVVDKNKTTLVVNNKSTAVQEKIAQLKNTLAETTVEFERDMLLTRINRLEAKTAVISVGGPSSTAIEAKKAKIDDAKNATLAAVKEGLILGGATAYIRAEDALKAAIDVAKKSDYNTDIITGMNIVLHALKAPLTTLIKNSGIDDPSIINQVRMTNDLGFNAVDNTVCALETAGIVDPVLVVRNSLEKAAGVVGTVLTTETVVYTEDDGKAEAQADMKVPKFW